MRCEDVIRELARPAGVRDEDALAGHLARCDRCSAEAARVARFERLWDATRPADVPGEAWEQVWAGIQMELGRRESGSGGPRLEMGLTPAVPPRTAHRLLSSSRWRSAASIGLVGIAQAAALLLAIGLSWRDPVGDPRPVANPPAPSVARAVEVSLDSEFEFEDGQVPLIRSEGNTVRMIDLTERDSLNGEDPWMVLLNRVEGSSNAVMAMAE